MRLARFVLFSVVVVAFGFLRGPGESSSALAQDQPSCTMTVQPGESIQRAIDQAAEGAILCLAPGRWAENLAIQKSLTLRGTGKEPKDVQIVGAKEGHPVVRIESKGEIDVVIENLTAAEAKGLYCTMYEPHWICPYGLQALGKAKVLIRDIQVSNNNRVGVSVWGSAQVSLSHSQVVGNGLALEVVGSATVSLSHSQISNNGWGGWVWGLAQVSLAHSMVSGNGLLGFVVGDSATVILSHSQVSGNGIGVVVRGSAQLSLSYSTVSNNWFIGLDADIGSATVTLQNSIVSDNGSNGLSIGGLATVKVKGSEISGNGSHGIFLKENAVAEIWGNRIINNGGYGVALYREGCVLRYDSQHEFVGQVTGEGNTIPGKDEPDGNRMGDLCPPDYPWPPGFRK